MFLTDLYGDGNLTEVKVKGDRLAPKAKRSYQAVEIFLDGNWDKVFLQGSYTYAKSKGNTEGGVKSDIGQVNTSVTQDFDYIELTTDTFGYLPNDRRHSLKLFGNYEISDEWSVGGNLLVQSGRPINCLGMLYPYHGGYHNYGSSFMRCGTTSAGQSVDPDTDELNGPVEAVPRGTKGRLPWTYSLDLNLRYAPAWAKGLSFKVDVFNVLNKQRVVSVIEQAEDPDTGLPSMSTCSPPPTSRRVRCASWCSTTSDPAQGPYRFASMAASGRPSSSVPTMTSVTGILHFVTVALSRMFAANSMRLSGWGGASCATTRCLRAIRKRMRETSRRANPSGGNSPRRHPRSS